MWPDLEMGRLHKQLVPPDRGYPGLNTAEGQNALMILTTSEANTAVVFLRSLPVPSLALTPVSEREHFF